MQKIDEADSARKPPRAMAYAYGFADRTRGDWSYREGDPYFDKMIDSILEGLTSRPFASLPYVVVLLDTGAELWIRALRSVVVNPDVAEVSIDLSAESGEIPF